MAYGLKIWGPNGSSVVFNESFMYSRLEYSIGFNLQPGSNLGFKSLANANDPAKVQVLLLTSPVNGWRATPWMRDIRLVLYSSGFNLFHDGIYDKTNSIPGVILAMRLRD